MILQALTAYYEELARQGRISRPGWAKVRVSYALELGEDGALRAVLPLEGVDEKGKPIPRYLELPAPCKRSVNIDANFLWDNAGYLLGMDGKGKPQRTKECFENAKALHLRLLGGSDDPFARAVCAFFSGWTPEAGAEDPRLAPYLKELLGGANLTFFYEGKLPDAAAALAAAWQGYYGGAAETAGEMRCLVTGERAVPEATHPAIMKLRGAQSSGAALVSFNAPAFCSYEREQSRNAPVGKYAAFAYTTALNRLLADAAHTEYLGDTAVVYWAEDAQVQYQDMFGCFTKGAGVTDGDLRSIMGALARGEKANFAGLPVDPANHFYILGLSPNAGRISVRFFLRDTFGAFAENFKAHYDRLDIIRPESDKDGDLPLWKLLRETVNPKAKDKSASPQMAADTLRAVFTNGLYPHTLYHQTLLRVKAERNVTRAKAAIVKAYLTKNAADAAIKEAATVSLNETSTYTPYVLGRLFSLLETIQNSATGASTVRESYFNAACATPAVAFPRLLKLKNSHARVLMREKPGLCIILERQVTELMGRLGESFPAQLKLEEQGSFLLGYYHQTQKRFGQKAAETAEEGNENV